MKFFSRIRMALFLLVIAFAISVSVIPSFATDAPVELAPVYETNPLLPECVVGETAPILEAGQNAPVIYAVSFDDAVAILRSALENRTASVRIALPDGYVPSSNDAYYVWNTSLEETGVPTQGDYIRWHWSTWNCSWDYEYTGKVYRYFMVYSVKYLTTYAQEASLTSEVDRIVDGFGFTSFTSDYEKVRTIHEWVTDNITYDYSNSGSMKQTAYNGVMKGTCVCQGYATIMYRMLLQVGVPARVIAGDTSPTPTPSEDDVWDNHGWNIVKLDDKWYNLDATWDAGFSEKNWSYFLTSPTSFPDHYRWPNYDTVQFHNDYPMAAEDYSPYIATGTCGNNLTWTLDNAGTLTISGTGAMTNYSSSSDAPWNANRSSVKQLVIGDGVTNISDWAFIHCYRLTEVNIPDSVTEIGAYAFSYCSGLTNVIIGDKVATIGDYAFACCVSLISVDIPDSVTGIGGFEFYGCSRLTDVTIGDGVTEIGDYAFSYCSSLTDVVIPDNVTCVGICAFEYCSNLTGVSIGAGVASIEKGVFANCENLTSVTISAGVTSIGQSAFGGRIDHVFYAGTQSEWETITIGNHNSELTDATRHYNMDGYTVIGCTTRGVYCSVCEKTIISGSGEHSFENGTCTLCGGEDSDYGAIVKFDFAGSTMTLGNTLEINFVIDNANVQGEGNYVVITKQYADERGLVTKTVPQSEWKDFSATRKYISFTVSAKEMNDQLTAAVYNAQGQQISNTYYDSVASYCVRMLGKEEQKTNPAMEKMALFVDMVNYGAAAQTEWSYNVEKLANAGLSEVQKGYATVVGETNYILVKGTGCVGTTLSLKDNILLNFVYENATINKAAYAIVSYTGYKGTAGDAVSYRIDASEFMALGGTMKYVQVKTLKVADYAQAVTLQLFDANGVELSESVESVESYLTRKYNDSALYPEIMAFCIGAYNYLT